MSEETDKTIDASDVPDDVFPDTADFVNRVLILSEKGYVELEGIFELTVGGRDWDLTFYTDPYDAGGLDDTGQSLVEASEGQRIVALTEDGVEAQGFVQSVMEEDNRLLLAAETPH